ncbi:MAG: Flp pilus assembly complex ATPase component TadA [Alphaproteobacteria bacterium]|nr:Flp pilus assembly complex ATPase component TadA [Alphaproteobacteria bacterium]
MPRIADIDFSDIYLTPEGPAYIHDGNTRFGLCLLENIEDVNDLRQCFEKAHPNRASYSVCYNGMVFRVERVVALGGVQFCARRMPKKTPDIQQLGFPAGLLKHLLTLNNSSGLILWSGPTGMGKTTSVSCLLRRYLEREGGFAYTIEDPPEMPLDGLYQSRRGGLGLCKQTEPPNGQWGDGLRSALRSRPRYIFVGEIRTGDTASQVLRAATSGHLVLSTIHANSVEDALGSILKYASSTGELSFELAADLLSRGLLGCVHQKLQGTKAKYPEIRFVFTNPDSTKSDPVRVIVRDASFNLATHMEAQMARMFKNEPIIVSRKLNKQLNHAI